MELEKAQKIADKLQRTPLIGVRDPPIKKPNVFVEKDRVLVGKINAKAKTTSELKKAIVRVVDAIGGFEKVIKKGERIFLKPNLNSDDPYPASTDPAFIKAVTELCYEFGAKEVIAGDCSGCYWLPTERALRLGVRKAVEDAGGRVITFDKGKWIGVNIRGELMQRVGIATAAYAFDKIIYLPCMKTHRSARFTLSLKLTMGFVHMADRMAMHASELERKLAEINLAVHPDLIIMDGRKCFTTSGPDVGRLENPNVILASGDRIACDVEALKVLKSYPANNMLKMPVWEFPQIAHAVKLGLGVKSEKEYSVVGR